MGQVIRPNPLAALLVLAAKLGLIALLIFLSYKLINIIMGFDVKDASTMFLSSADIYSEFGIQTKLLRYLALLPLLPFFLYYFFSFAKLMNNSWVLEKDKIIIRSGFILVKDREHPYSDIFDVFTKKYLPLIDFGKIIVRLKGEEQHFRLDYVVKAENKCQAIKNEIPKK